MKKNYIYNLILSVFNILFPILSFPYASRVLGPEGIGKFQFVTSFAQYFIMIAGLGIPIYGIREIAKYRDDKKAQSKVFSELFSIAFIMSVALTAIYLTVIIALNYFKSDSDLYLTATISVFLGFTTIDWLFAGLEEFRLIAIRSVVVKIISLILLYTLVKERSDVLIYLYIGIFSAVANNVYNLFSIRSRVQFSFRNLNFKRHIRPLLLIFSLSLATSIYTLLDVVLLGFLADPRSLGLYSAAVKLSKIALPFLTSVGTVLMPKVSHQFALNNIKEIQNLLNKSLHFILLFSIPVFAGLFLLAPEFIVVFSGREFLEGALSMQILALLPVLIGLGYFWGFQVLIPAGKDKETAFAVLGGMIAAIVLNLVLVPGLKHVGASIANVITELIVTLLYVYFAKKSYSFVLNWSSLYKGLAGALLFVPAIYIIRMFGMGPLLTLIISIITCAVLYIMMQWIVFKDYLMEEFYNSLMIKLNLRVKGAHKI